jgi:hypothetical protein
MNDTINSIVDCETSWTEIQENIRAWCCDYCVRSQKYIRDCQEQIRQERIEEEKRKESNRNSFRKIAKRLSIFG